MRAMRETRIASPSRNAPHPRAAHHRVPSAGADTTPTAGTPSCSSAISVAQTGIPPRVVLRAVDRVEHPATHTVARLAELLADDRVVRTGTTDPVTEQLLGRAVGLGHRREVGLGLHDQVVGAEPFAGDRVGTVRELEREAQVGCEVGGDPRNVANPERRPARLSAMARRFLVAGAIIAASIVLGTAVALLTRDDDSPDTTVGVTTTTTRAATTSTIASTAPPTSTEPTLITTTTTTQPENVLPDPCGAESAAIRAAIDNGIEGARDLAQIDECRLAAADMSWALVQVGPRPGTDFAALTVMVQGGGGAWAVVDQGTVDVGCGTAPQQVLVDLGVFCTGTGGDA